MKLDNFQTEAINDIKSNNNVLVVAPTGSGKTLIAERSIDYYLDLNKSIFYTTPIKALSNQKYNDFKAMGYDVGLLTGDRNINQNSQLIVATTEILRNMIFAEDERLNNVGLIVLDEVHYLADKERGTTWEEVLIHANRKIKFLCLSATIKNKNEFLEWIVSIRGTTSLVHSIKRPVPLKTSLISKSHISNNLIFMDSDKNDSNKIFKSANRRRSFIKPKLNEIISYISKNNLEPLIIFYFSREKTESNARSLTSKSTVSKEKASIKKKFDEVFSDLSNEEKDLLNLDEQLWMWTRGIGYHHAGLAPIVKEFIEYLFINKYIKYLFATETLALGVNLPAKSILINNLNKFDGFKTRLINNSEFLQLSGRAGRRGIDTQGFAFLNYDKNVNFEWYKNLFKLKPSILKSAFSVNYSSVIKLNNLYTKEEALNLLNKSFYSYQNFSNIENLKSTFLSRYKILDELDILNTREGLILSETYRDSLLPGVILFNSEESKNIEFYMMFIATGISTELSDIGFNDEFQNIYAKYESINEMINRVETKHNLNKLLTVNYSLFSLLIEYMRTNNIEYVVNKFNINIGDFIKISKEVSELSKKLFTLYDDKEFENIHKIFNNKLVMKSMI